VTTKHNIKDTPAIESSVPYLFLSRRHVAVFINSHNQALLDTYQPHFNHETCLLGAMGIEEVYPISLIVKNVRPEELVKDHRIVFTLWDNPHMPHRGILASDAFVEKHLKHLLKGTYSTYGGSWLFAKKFKDSEPLLAILEEQWTKKHKIRLLF
jgi:hypothetical protein